jgi:hypothetical protein
MRASAMSIILCTMFFGTMFLGTAATVCAQTGDAPPANAESLALRQGRIADKYARLEQLMLKMAELDAAENPQRAALLRQAVQQSKDSLTRSRLETIVSLLDKQQLKRAVDGQTEATTEMKGLLELLLSENRTDRNKSEQDRVKQYIKEVERLIRLHKDVQGRTEGGEKTESVAKDQGKVAERTGDLSKQIQEDEAPADPGQPGSEAPAQPMDPNPSEQTPGNKTPDEQQPGEKQPGEPMPGEQAPGEPMPSEPMPGEANPGEANPAQPMPGQPGQPGAGGESQPTPPMEQPEQQNPARKRLQAAEQKMREAQKKLEEANRDGAKDDQEKARQELEKAKADLEEILRQLREEEIERTLAQLEARFRKMLELQLKVNDSTLRLESIPAADRGREVDIAAGKLAVDQRKIALEAEKAYNLLLEEGSSIAFPESVEQMRSDMEQVAERLGRTKLDPLTIGIEEEIVTALNEMIAALDKAQKDKEDNKQPPPPPPGGEPQDEPLVDQIAELKMIKALQLRVNERTNRYAKMLVEPEDVIGQATERDLQDAIEQLGGRQEKLHQITRDIVLGRNQ